MADELDAAFDAGAFGLSIGLEYPLGARATTDRARRPRLGRRPAGRPSRHPHPRSRLPGRRGVRRGVLVAERSGAALQISHIAPRRGAPEALSSTSSNGSTVAAPKASTSPATSTLATTASRSSSRCCRPRPRRRDGRAPAPAARSGDRALVPRLPRADPQARPDGRVGPSVAVRGAEVPELVGKDFATIGRERGQHPLDAMMDILLEAGDDAPTCCSWASSRRRRTWTWRSPRRPARPSRTPRRFRPTGHWRANGFSAPTPGPPSTSVASSGSAGLSLEEGVRRLTSMPAARVGLPDRGILAPGAWADITIFDPDEVLEQGTLAEPNAFPVGIRQVFVNGRLAFDEGRFADGRSGAVLRGRPSEAPHELRPAGGEAVTIMTVLGPIEDDQLGVTQPHEHLVINLYRTVAFWNYAAFEDEALDDRGDRFLLGGRRPVDRGDDDDRHRSRSEGAAQDLGSERRQRRDGHWLVPRARLPGLHRAVERQRAGRPAGQGHRRRASTGPGSGPG